MKKLKRFAVAIMAVCMIMFSSLSSYAAVCGRAPDGIHHFDGHRDTGAGYAVSRGTHSYLYGKVDGRYIYKDDCEIVDHYNYCERYCVYCNSGLSGSKHSEFNGTTHSIRH